MNNLYGYAMSKFLPTSRFKWIDPKKFELKKYTNNSSKWCVLEVYLEYPKKLRELHDGYCLANSIVWVLTKDCWFIQYSYW